MRAGDEKLINSGLTTLELKNSIAAILSVMYHGIFPLAEEWQRDEFTTVTSVLYRVATYNILSL